MIGYVTLGTNDLPRAAAFYDELMTEIGAARLWDFGRGIAWGIAQDKPCLGIMKPYDVQGDKYEWAARTTIVVDKQGIIQHVQEDDGAVPLIEWFDGLHSKQRYGTRTTVILGMIRSASKNTKKRFSTPRSRARSTNCALKPASRNVNWRRRSVRPLPSFAGWRIRTTTGIHSLS